MQNEIYYTNPQLFLAFWQIYTFKNGYCREIINQVQECQTTGFPEIHPGIFIFINIKKTADCKKREVQHLPLIKGRVRKTYQEVNIIKLSSVYKY
ncbi:hypothetical protein CEN39_02990 [Fischerella thermalis CCMEE 5201]|nr:hypothetical protein CEN39_02990 [Fischerella thermalis CCMEE 5201]